MKQEMERLALAYQKVRVLIPDTKYCIGKPG